MMQQAGELQEGFVDDGEALELDAQALEVGQPGNR
ncbi:hypothetical protein CTP10_R71300 (plasmid) [Cupriavidus sp. P-10]|nr:hypothetical protein CTP10_R71300 [Cupriavidus sp. P-10]